MVISAIIFFLSLHLLYGLQIIHMFGFLILPYSSLLLLLFSVLVWKVSSSLLTVFFYAVSSAFIFPRHFSRYFVFYHFDFYFEFLIHFIFLLLMFILSSTILNCYNSCFHALSTNFIIKCHSYICSFWQIFLSFVSNIFLLLWIPGHFLLDAKYWVFYVVWCWIFFCIILNIWELGLWMK